MVSLQPLLRFKKNTGSTSRKEKQLELSFLSPDACGQHFPTLATATSDTKPRGKWWSQTSRGFPAAWSSGQQTSALSSLPATTGEGTGPHIWTNRYISSQKPALQLCKSWPKQRNWFGSLLSGTEESSLPPSQLDTDPWWPTPCQGGANPCSASSQNNTRI